jgi:hypothetical protein
MEGEVAAGWSLLLFRLHTTHHEVGWEAGRKLKKPQDLAHPPALNLMKGGGGV